jgi:membrane protein DedA with SNARE-associated domain
MMENPLSGLTSWVTDIIESFSYFGVVLMTALENLIPPIPSEIVLPFAGFLVSQGRFSFLLVVLAASIGSVTGALILYAMGAGLGEARLRYLIKKFGRFVMIDDSDLDKSHDWFQRHGTRAILLGRLVPGMRSLISIPAGLVSIPLWQFVLYTFIGSTIWNTTLIGFGWALGAQWKRVEAYTSILQYIVIVIVAVAGFWFLWNRRDRVLHSLRRG